MTNLDEEIAKAKAKAKAEYKSKMRRLKSAQKQHDDRVTQIIVTILEEKNPELYSQLWSAAERALAEQSRQRAQKARERKARVAEQGQGEQNAQQS